MSATELIGSAGVGLLFVAFLLNLVSNVRRDSWTYMVMNAIGAGLACYAALLIGFLPFVVLQGTWSLVAVIKLVLKLCDKK